MLAAEEKSLSINPADPDRVTRILEHYNRAEPFICMERARATTRAYSRTEGLPPVLRRARAFREVCESMPVIIYDHELIVGSSGAYRRSAGVSPEISWQWIKEEIDSFETRAQDPYRIEDHNRRELMEDILPYWQGKSIEEAFLARLPRDTARVAVDTGIVDNDSKWRCAIGEITPDYADVIFKKGFGGIKAEASRRLEDLDPSRPGDLEKSYYYRAVLECCDGLIAIGRRYAEKALEMAEKETDPARKKELSTIADICLCVPENPPENFRQAMQMVWTVQLGNTFFENAVALNIGRFDQFMNPFYEADLKNGTLTRDEAGELICCLWIKLSEWVWFVSKNTAGYFAGYNAFQNLTVGGRKADGTDGTNEISYLCLEATDRVRTNQPGLSVRIHSNCPQEFLLKVCELVKAGTGFPAIHNDRIGAEMLTAVGLSPEDALDWSNCGCVVPHSRKISEWTSACNINLAAGMEFIFNNGRGRITGRKYGAGPVDLDGIDTFDKFKVFYFRELDHLIKHAVIATNVAQEVQAELCPRPYFSSFTQGCLAKGLDVSQGGAMYNVGPVLTAIGIADAANSLAAVKSLVFERKVLDLSKLALILADDWAGFEDYRQMALKCPKYGNDDDFVDLLATEISNHYHREIARYKDRYGSRFNSAFMGISNYIPTGKAVGATPDGRKAMEPLTEGCSPHAGTDVTSPTAAMRSTAKINHNRHAGGTLLNIKLSPAALKTRRDLNLLAALIRGYFELDAFHVQFNVIDRETLLEAREHPEKHQNLLIRVAGYSTRFVTLSREVQDAIIARTSYEAM